jgi:hypothetical protein
VIVDDLDIVNAVVVPPKADPPPVVDPDAVLTVAVAAKGLEAVAWRNQEDALFSTTCLDGDAGRSDEVPSVVRRGC